MSTCCPSIFVRPLREIIFPQPVASTFVLAEEAVLTTPQIAPSLLAKWDYWSSLCSMSGSRQTHTHFDFVPAPSLCVKGTQIPTYRSDHVAAGCWCRVPPLKYRGSARGKMFHFDIHANRHLRKVAQQSTIPHCCRGNVSGGEGRRREADATRMLCRGWFWCQIVSPLSPNSGTLCSQCVCGHFHSHADPLPWLRINALTKCIKRLLYLQATVPF